MLLANQIRALETTEKVIARLVLSPEQDAVIDRLLAGIEKDRAELLAAMIGGHAARRKTRHLRTAR